MLSRDVEYNRLEATIIKMLRHCDNIMYYFAPESEDTNDLVMCINRIIQYPAGYASEALLLVLSRLLEDKCFHSAYASLLYKFAAWFKIAFSIYSPSMFDKMADVLNFQVKYATKQGMRFIISKPEIRNLTIFAYLSDNEKIINLFKKYLTVPKASIFKGFIVPEYVRSVERQAAVVIKSFTNDDTDKLRQLERSAITIQRFFRAHQRRREECIRMTQEVDAYKVMLDASQPYIPKKCRADLAIRIVNVASKVVLFHSIYHYTDRAHLTSIFDDGLYGRRSLLQHHLEFVPTSLCHTDIGNGDENMICFAPNYVDTNALDKGVQIELDLKRMDMTNPCILYKQADLCMYYHKVRRVRLGESEIYFTHTGPRPPDKVSFELLEHVQSFGRNTTICTTHAAHVIGVARINNESLISYNRAQIHQVLILNFFRFLDALDSCDQSKYTKSAVDDIYNRIDALNDAELAKFLFDVGKNISDTAEFNFYGAHLIDFDTLTTIRLYKREIVEGSTTRIIPYYIFNLPELIKDLQRGNLASYQELQSHLPEVADSYRLHDYLLTKISHPQVVIELQRQRNRCDAPSFRY